MFPQMPQKSRGHDATSNVAYVPQNVRNALRFKRASIFNDILGKPVKQFTRAALLDRGEMRTLDYSAILPPCAATRGIEAEMSAID